MADNYLTKPVCPCGQFAVSQLMSSKGRACYGSFSPDDVNQALPEVPRVLTDLISEYAVGCKITRLIPCFKCKRFAGIEGVNHYGKLTHLFQYIICYECRLGLSNQCGINIDSDNYSYDLYKRRHGVITVFPRTKLKGFPK